MADAAEQATIASSRVTAALAALGQELGTRLTVQPKTGLDVATDPDLQAFRDACELLNAAPAGVVRLDFLPGVVQVHRADSVTTLEVVDA